MREFGERTATVITTPVRNFVSRVRNDWAAACQQFETRRQAEIQVAVEAYRKAYGYETEEETNRRIAETVFDDLVFVQGREEDRGFNW